MILLIYTALAWMVILLSAAAIELCNKDRDWGEVGALAGLALLGPILLLWHTI